VSALLLARLGTGPDGREDGANGSHLDSKTSWHVWSTFDNGVSGLTRTGPSTFVETGDTCGAL
jgi:hypothetical protein